MTELVQSRQTIIECGNPLMGDPRKYPLTKGPTKKSPLVKGVRGLFFTGICRVYKKSLS